jgi:hypothetical protein
MEGKPVTTLFYFKSPGKRFSGNINSMESFPLLYDLKDGTHVLVNQLDPHVYEFHLTRLNSEKYNFTWIDTSGPGLIDDNYELRFSELEQEALAHFREWFKNQAEKVTM